MSSAVLHLIENRARAVTLVSAVVVAVAFAIGSTVIPRMDAGSAQFADLSSESRLANLEVERQTGVEADPGILALVSGGAAAVERARARIDRDPAVARTLVDDNGVVLAFLRARGGDASKQAADRLTTAFAGDRAVRLGGGAIASRQVTEAIQSDLRRAELLAFPLVFLLSFWVFRGLVAAFLPPLVGAGAIALTFLGLRLAVEVHSIGIATATHVDSRPRRIVEGCNSTQSQGLERPELAGLVASTECLGPVECCLGAADGGVGALLGGADAFEVFVFPGRSGLLSSFERGLLVVESGLALVSAGLGLTELRLMAI